VPLSKEHDRSVFNCGDAKLDDWLKTYAGQSQDLRIAKTYALVRQGTKQVLGYFALRAGQVERERMPESLRKRLPRYPIPVVHLARLAVDQSVHGEGLGGDLLIATLEKALTVSGSIGAHGIEVLAKNDAARKFYLHYQFTPLLDDGLHLYLPMAVVKKLLAAQFRKNCAECGKPMEFQGIDALGDYGWLCSSCNSESLGHLTMQTIELRCSRCRTENTWMNRAAHMARSIKVGAVTDIFCRTCRARTDQEILSIRDDNPE
jgi:GNAT superfamily N-acetyltransferase/endogenous inhibitor of DNA gyrase (YacG/DUF329 family)